MQQRKWAMLAAGAMLSTMLTGCMENHGELGNKNIRGNSVSYDMNGNRILNTRFANDQLNEMNRVDGHRLNSNNLVGLHKNYRLEMSESLGDRISNIKGVGKAYVMLTDNNAYVAVTLKNGAAKNGTNAMGFSAPTPLGRTQRGYMHPYSTGMSSSIKSSNAHAFTSKHKSGRASSIATPNMKLHSSGKGAGIIPARSANSHYMLGQSMNMRSMNGKTIHAKNYGYASSSYYNAANGVRNMSLSMSGPSGMNKMSGQAARGYTGMSHGLSMGNDWYRGPSNGGRDIYRGSSNAAIDLNRNASNTGTNLSRNAMDTGRNLTRNASDAGRNMFRGMAGAGADLTRGTGNVGRNLANAGTDVVRGTAEAGRDVARGTVEAGRDVVRGTVQTGRDVTRGAADLTRDAARGTTNVGRDVARGMRDLTEGTADLLRGTTGLSRDVARDTTDSARNMRRDMTGLSVTRNTADLNRSSMPHAASRTYATGDAASAIKDQIAKEIKQMAPQIKNVYVSANADFVERMSAYMSDYKSGKPIQGYIAEFNAMVERIFPARFRS
ncbi:YhcN/YlaJ family sporulation lipoprotein [Paenibacillus sacheonensis]|uniref:Sporulation lipoprotein, YhcN/YlaJ family n=1 Tax=Paenibacillus sacheonensis TaxID=742054 RepID=A0A7X5C0N9_9BACL|nr:YhcN/YlaJ family sporulation lipoprotein [Paenibacillus sacheonensis]MBM7569228.1 hypothetical protein [Paenibacillus sacheonensis]NBC71761.1 hypothetical protein [Paenibacillus sacheonensis]